MRRPMELFSSCQTGVGVGVYADMDGFKIISREERRYSTAVV